MTCLFFYRHLARCYFLFLTFFLLLLQLVHIHIPPQGHPERKKRVKDMLAQHDREGFGGCSNQYQCEAACPKAISIGHIARLNREYLRALLG